MDDATAQTLLDFVMSEFATATLRDVDESDLPMTPDMILHEMIESLQRSDSYGVYGSDFEICECCDAGGSPCRRYVHSDTCPVGIAENALREWQAFESMCREFADGGGI